MKPDIIIYSAYAHRDNEKEMSLVVEPIVGWPLLLEEISAMQQGSNYLFNERGDTMYLIMFNPDMAACFTIEGVDEDQGDEIMDEWAHGDENLPAAERLFEAVEAIIGETLERPH